jgi:Putative inner membrane exporter, YdcZ
MPSAVRSPAAAYIEVYQFNALVGPTGRPGRSIRGNRRCPVRHQAWSGAFAGLTITANILMSLAIDKFGSFGMEVHPLNGWRMLGAALMVSGITLIAKF